MNTKLKQSLITTSVIAAIMATQITPVYAAFVEGNTTGTIGSTTSTTTSIPATTSTGGTSTDVVVGKTSTSNNPLVKDSSGILMGSSAAASGVIPEGADPCATIGQSIAEELKAVIEQRIPRNTVSDAVTAAGTFTILNQRVNLSNLYALDMSAIATEAVKIGLDTVEKVAREKIQAEFKRALGNGLSGFNYTNSDWSADVRAMLGG
jgi:hypothetical protein